jgi:hypothetical protein
MPIPLIQSLLARLLGSTECKEHARSRRIATRRPQHAPATPPQRDVLMPPQRTFRVPQRAFWAYLAERESHPGSAAATLAPRPGPLRHCVSTCGATPAAGKRHPVTLRPPCRTPRMPPDIARSHARGQLGDVLRGAGVRRDPAVPALRPHSATTREVSLHTHG